ncbi:hypothetical protein [Kineosporia sp. NBRC 101731]|uniref:hypothetical protein n=1 Tax=Kineosporia sp. NBRC 101731 TaxID=3032199 RepID=UPI0024A04F27|nr:hypothetical protein [Kineosporia sp. NBRC 101731]GLY28573.1 hypothetical protein Kisp02_19380 [Kineosporia sp. NBRC 101731]
MGVDVLTGGVFGDGVMGEPGRIHCPKNLTPLKPIPLPPRDNTDLESYLHPEDAP